MRSFKNHERIQTASTSTSSTSSSPSNLDLENLTVDQLIQSFYQRLHFQHDTISQLIRPLDRSFIRTIRSIIPSDKKDHLDSIVDKQISDDRVFADFVSNYLNYLLSVQLQDDPQLDPTSHVFDGPPSKPSEPTINHGHNFDILLNVYIPASNIFRRPDAAYFTHSIQILSHSLVHFAITADRKTKSNKNEKASAAARQMTTTLGVACIDRSPDEPSKRRAAFSLANGLFKIYFFLNNMRLCDTVVKNISNVINQLETHYPKAELVTFHYYLGRLSLYQRKFHQARESLKKAFDLCKSDSWRNRRLLLIYLIVASLPLGILPRPILLEHFQLEKEFQEVVGNLRTANWPGVIHGLEKNRDWFRYKGIYILLREKLEVICWRNFFVIMAGLRNGNPGMRLSLSNSVEAARKVFLEPSIDEDDIVCMASSLIDQGYLKAYVKLGEMIVFGSALPQISTVTESAHEGEQVTSSGTVPTAMTVSRGSTFSQRAAAVASSLQSGSDDDRAPKPPKRQGFKFKGAKKTQHPQRFF